ncbi:MAG TPA: hypothetical protein PKI44_06085 [Candidatus Omnitrophota bacterium]|nr:hypothetical protein [Candidatus Omnitrophota bacterium]
MKKVLFVLIALCFVSSLAFAAESTATAVTTDTNTALATELSTTATTQIEEPAVATAATEAVTPAKETATTEVAATVATPAAVTTEAAATTEPALTTPATTATDTLETKGTIVDMTCATANKDNLAEFVKTHTKECALKPGCIESGYAIVAFGKIHIFDKDSNAKVAEFLKQADSKLEVVITAKQVGDELSLVSIKNQN